MGGRRLCSALAVARSEGTNTGWRGRGGFVRVWEEEVCLQLNTSPPSHCFALDVGMRWSVRLPTLHPASLPLTAAPLPPVCLPCRSEYAESLNSLLDSIRFQLTGETPIQGEETYIASFRAYQSDKRGHAESNEDKPSTGVVCFDWHWHG